MSENNTNECHACGCDLMFTTEISLDGELFCTNCGNILPDVKEVTDEQ